VRGSFKSRFGESLSTYSTNPKADGPPADGQLTASRRTSVNIRQFQAAIRRGAARPLATNCATWTRHPFPSGRNTPRAVRSEPGAPVIPLDRHRAASRCRITPCLQPALRVRRAAAGSFWQL